MHSFPSPTPNHPPVSDISVEWHPTGIQMKLLCILGRDIHLFIVLEFNSKIQENLFLKLQKFGVFFSPQQMLYANVEISVLISSSAICLCNFSGEKKMQQE